MPIIILARGIGLISMDILFQIVIFHRSLFSLATSVGSNPTEVMNTSG